MKTIEIKELDFSDFTTPQQEIIQMIDDKINYLEKCIFLANTLYIDGAIQALKELKKQIKERYGLE